MKSFSSVFNIVGVDVFSLLSSGDFHDLKVTFDCEEICLSAKISSLRCIPSLNQDTSIIFADSDQVVLKFYYEYSND